MRDQTDISTVSPGIMRLMAANPSPMTGTGTNTYIIFGPDGAVVIDPGPNLEPHLSAISAVLGDTELRAVLVTHAHLDHSALAPPLAQRHHAPVLAFGQAAAGRTPRMQALADQGLAGGGEGIDLAFSPDGLLADEDTVNLAGLALKVIHTPGHMGGHLCFGLGDVLFSGDHVMGWASSLVSPPDGDMSQYMASLARLAARPWAKALPGHGAPIKDVAARLAELTGHRHKRGAAILAALGTAPSNAYGLATLIYTDTAQSLLPAAARNILAHLIDLHDQNLIICYGPISPEAVFAKI